MADLARRGFLALVGLGSAGLGGWFLARVAEGTFDPETLAAQWRGARADRRPLLILVIPDDRSIGWQRGKRLGEWFNHGSPELMAALALYRVVAATPAQIDEVFPGTAVADGARVELLCAFPQEGAPLLEAWRLPPGQPPSPFREPMEGEWSWEREEARQAVQHEERMATLTPFVQQQLWPAPERLAALARANEEALPGRLVAQLDTPNPGRAVLARGALAWLGRAQRAGWPAEQLQQVLSAAAADQLRLTPPQGALWARSSGCGSQIEGRDLQLIAACGMGHVAQHQVRFLEFYSDV